MKSFSPLLWYPGERADLGFDLVEEFSHVSTNRREVAAKKKCGYEFWDEPLADGILVSKTLLEQTTNLRKVNGAYKVHVYKYVYDSVLDYCATKGRYIPSFADPGTWSYVNQFKLPDYLYDTDHMISYYQDMQYDLAGSVDWPIIDKLVIVDNYERKYVDLDDKTKEMRRELTLELAADFIKKCNRRPELQFVPFGTIQGYSPESYIKSLKRILKMGYEYIAIGGLPAYSEKVVVELLPLLWKEIRKADPVPGVHLYGRFPSPKYVKYYIEHGVTSFDNNSAFITAAKNPCSFYDPDYLILEHEQSPAFRCYGVKIPSRRGPLLRKLKKYRPDLWEEAGEVSDKTFSAFCRFAINQSKNNKERLFKYYYEMDRILNDARVRPHHEKKLVQSFERCKTAINSRGWERCGCTSCRMLGPHILLMRGARIPHTFLHNTYTMYSRFRIELKKAEKNVKLEKPYDWSKVMEFNRLKNVRKAIRPRR